LLTGLGAATADALYGCVGAFGLTLISGLLLGYAPWIKLIGGLFLCWLGISTFLANPKEDSDNGSDVRYATAFLSTAVLTLANPATILSFMAVFAGLGLGARAGDYAAAGTVVAGVFLGSAIWWLMLSGGVSLARHRLAPSTLRLINRGSAIFLLAFGVTALSSLLRR
jgi:threonine/homoserine/homoserine lactone efflux protein